MMASLPETSNDQYGNSTARANKRLASAGSRLLTRAVLYQSLEIDAPSQLDSAWRIQLSGDAAKLRIVDVRHRSSEHNIIHRVEEFSAEFKLDPFGDAESFPQSKIQVDVIVSANTVERP